MKGFKMSSLLSQACYVHIDHPVAGVVLCVSRLVAHQFYSCSIVLLVVGHIANFAIVENVIHSVQQRPTGECNGQSHFALESGQLGILDELDASQDTEQRGTKLVADRGNEGTLRGIRRYGFDAADLGTEGMGEGRDVSKVLLRVKEAV